MRDIAIVADDLTGAVDAAAAFATPASPVLVGWQALAGPRIAFDSESRSLPATDVLARLQLWLPFFDGSATAFKKIDSQLRGNSFIEMTACYRSGRFDLLCVAPAFPAQGRVTVDGEQIVTPSGTRVSLRERFRQLGADAILSAPGESPPERGVVVFNAATEADLAEVVRGVGRDRPRVLWCGSAGLAQALAVSSSRALMPRRATLAIIGSRHTVSRADAARLQDRLGPHAYRLVAPEQAIAIGDAVAAALAKGERTALCFDLPELEAEAAASVYATVFRRLARSGPPETAIVVGGDTLFRLVAATGANALETIGQFAPGLPVSHLRGGNWSGAAIISKSGAFDDAGLFDDFLQEELKRA